MASGLRIALLQLLAREKTANILQKAEQYISEAANNGAKLAILPELFTTECHPPIFVQKKESIPEGETSKFISHLAKKHSMHIIAGSIAEEIKGSEKMKNTSAVFNPMGELIGKYTKSIHRCTVLTWTWEKIFPSMNRTGSSTATTRYLLKRMSVKLG